MKEYFKSVFEIIKEINEQGTSIMLVEQNAKKALKICDRAYVLNVGNVMKTGTRDELLADETLTSAYLG